jgi:thiamine biosynthesis lipoprotein
VTAADDEAAVAGHVAATFVGAERRFSRFRHDSELAELNRAHGPVVVSAPLFAALERAREYVELTGGLFDPGIGGALNALGYDRSFVPGTFDRAHPRRRPRAGHLAEVILDPRTRTVRRPDHVHIDLGGMIKGGTVDEAAAHLRGPGVVDAGGDARLCGPAPDGGDWLVDIEDPVRRSSTVATLAVRDRAVATSAANRRCWRVAGALAHHLIDPRTQNPAVTDLLQVTVVAPCAELADVLAKAAFILGSRGARPFLSRQAGVGAVLVRASGAPLLVGDIELREAARVA